MAGFQEQSVDIASVAFKANPYPVFRQLRTADPVHRIVLAEGHTAWLITRYKDGEEILRDQRFVKDIRRALSSSEVEKQLPWLKGVHMLSSDPPDHTRLRTLISSSLTPRLVEQWHERIQFVTHELLNAVAARGTMDLIGDFALPLSITVIAEMLGVASADHTRFRAWSRTIVETANAPSFTPQMRALLEEFQAYLLTLISQKRAHPSNDLLSKMIEAESAGDRLSEQELIATTILMIIGGHETTVNLIGNGMLALLLHQEQLQRLKERPELLKTAIEEFLRYHSPLMIATQRWASTDIEVSGKLIQRGELVFVALASANHDEAVIACPEQLDITREANRHLAFGKGIHYCPGASLARLEGQIALSTLLQRMPDIHLTVSSEDLEWQPGIMMIGLRRMPVAF